EGIENGPDSTTNAEVQGREEGEERQSGRRVKERMPAEALLCIRVEPCPHITPHAPENTVIKAKVGRRKEQKNTCAKQGYEKDGDRPDKDRSDSCPEQKGESHR